MAYSDKVLDHYNNPRNVGSMDKNDPNVGTGMVGAPECGDVMKLQLKVNEIAVLQGKSESLETQLLEKEYAFQMARNVKEREREDLVRAADAIWEEDLGIVTPDEVGDPLDLGLRTYVNDDRVLPESASSHAVGDQLRHDFADNSATAVSVVVPDARGVRPGDLSRYAADLSRVADVSAVSAPTGTFVGGRQVGPPSAATRASSPLRFH